MKVEIIENLKALVAPTIEAQGAFLVDLTLRGDRGFQVVEIFCETENGITIERCAEISRQVMPLLESSNAIDGNFRLEVSSPGVGSTIKNRKQYRSNLGRLFSVSYKENEAIKQIEGELTELKENGIVLRTDTAVTELKFDSIVDARVKIRW